MRIPLFIMWIQKQKDGCSLKGKGDRMQVSLRMTLLRQKKIERAEFDHRMKEHAKWLKDHKEGKRADLRDVDLGDMDLTEMDFSYADMTGVSLRDSDLTGANLSYANLWRAFLFNANLTRTILDETVLLGADFREAVLDECKGEKAQFSFAQMGNCDIKNASLKKASFLGADLYNCDFTGSDLEEAGFAGADFDDSIFVDTKLCNADFSYAQRTYWTDFANSDMTGLRTAGVDLNPDKIKGVKGLHMHLFCPEEGSFIAWKKCREEKIVKLLIPEHAGRKGNTANNCRASEAVVLEIYDKDGNPVDEAYSQYDKQFKYVKGKTVVAKELDPKRFGDVSGIYFVLSRADAEVLPDITGSEEDEENE